MGLYLWKTTTPKGGVLVKLIEPPCTERYARWCERSVGEIIAYLLLDFAFPKDYPLRVGCRQEKKL